MGGAGSRAAECSALSYQSIASKSASVQTVWAAAGPVLLPRLRLGLPGEHAGARARRGDEVVPAGCWPPRPG
jgi:hypothetical protein